MKVTLSYTYVCMCLQQQANTKGWKLKFEFWKCFMPMNGTPVSLWECIESWCSFGPFGFERVWKWFQTFAETLVCKVKVIEGPNVENL